jgi:hypothetical protein
MQATYPAMHAERKCLLATKSIGRGYALARRSSFIGERASDGNASGSVLFGGRSSPHLHGAAQECNVAQQSLTRAIKSSRRNWADSFGASDPT